jgi:hypothetical protein
LVEVDCGERSESNVYGAVHLVTTYRVQPNYNQNRKVNFARISYPFSRNASFDARNISSEAILLNVKIDGDNFYILPQFGGDTIYTYIAVHARGLFPKMVIRDHISIVI